MKRMERKLRVPRTFRILKDALPYWLYKTVFWLYTGKKPPHPRPYGYKPRPYGYKMDRTESKRKTKGIGLMGEEIPVSVWDDQKFVFFEPTFDGETIYPVGVGDCFVKYEGRLMTDLPLFLDDMTLDGNMLEPITYVKYRSSGSGPPLKYVHLDDDVEVADVSNNYIESLDLPEGLVCLKCRNNRIKRLRLPKSLKFLECDNTVKIKDLDEVMEKNPYLEIRMM